MTVELLDDVRVSAVPEPATWFLTSVSLIVLGVLRRRQSTFIGGLACTTSCFARHAGVWALWAGWRPGEPKRLPVGGNNAFRPSVNRRIPGSVIALKNELSKLPDEAKLPRLRQLRHP